MKRDQFGGGEILVWAGSMFNARMLGVMLLPRTKETRYSNNMCNLSEAQLAQTSFS